MAFTRWVRSASQQELLTAAQTRMATRAGLATRKPKGKEVFWQKVYAPVFHRLPTPMRDKVIEIMPGSHRRTWHRPAQASGPAASVTKAWHIDLEQLAQTVGGSGSETATTSNR
jgi:hypothetical protein